MFKSIFSNISPYTAHGPWSTCFSKMPRHALVELLFVKLSTRAHVRGIDFTDNASLFKGQLLLNVSGNNFLLLCPRFLHESFFNQTNKNCHTYTEYMWWTQSRFMSSITFHRNTLNCACSNHRHLKFYQTVAKNQLIKIKTRPGLLLLLFFEGRWTCGWVSFFLTRTCIQ